MVLITLDVVALICLWNVTDVSNIKPKCIGDGNCYSWFSLKETGGYTIFMTLQLKKTSEKSAEKPIPVFCLTHQKDVKKLHLSHWLM